MKKLTFILLLISFCSLGQSSKQTESGLKYLEYIDPNCINGNCPILIFLHGSGECGTDLTLVQKNGLSKLLKSQGLTYLKGFTLLVPQRTSTNWGWIAEPTNPLIINFSKWARLKYKNDGRLYLTGISMGGNGSWSASYSKYGNDSLITAFVSVSGGGDYKQSKITAQRKTPVWAIHGDTDAIVPLQLDLNAIAGMNTVDANPKPILTVIKGGGHNAAVWDLAYSLTPRVELGNTTIYEWMLTHGRRTARR